MVDGILKFIARNKPLVFIFAVFFIGSCSNEDIPKGKWDDNIKLSVKSSNFKAKGDSITITTEGETWWIDLIEFEDSTYFYYDSEYIDVLSDNYSIKENEFQVERRNKHTLFIKLNENISGRIRILKVNLEAGNYFDRVTIIQAAE